MQSLLKCRTLGVIIHLLIDEALGGYNVSFISAQGQDHGGELVHVNEYMSGWMDG